MKSIVAIASLGVERKFRLNPSRQIAKLKRWARSHGWTVARAFYFTDAVHPTLKVDAIGLAIAEARKADGVIIVLDTEGKPTVLMVENSEGRIKTP